MIALVDYHKGNIMSVARGLEQAGAEVVASDDPAEIARAAAIVLPGVGAFADAMATLDELHISEVLRSAIAKDVPFLGICLGLHLLYEQGEEGALEGADGQAWVLPQGLGVLQGTVRAIPRTDASGATYKIPHVGWNSIERTSAYREQDHASLLLEGIPDGEWFYFTHSYMAPQSGFDVALTTHSVTFPSVVVAGKRAWGVQFHPEKSSDAGARLLRNFVAIARSE